MNAWVLRFSSLPAWWWDQATPTSVPETRAWPHALAFGTVDQSPVVINTLLAAGTDVKSDVRDAKTPLDLLIQVLSEFEK